MNVLGISSIDKDSTVSLVIDGKVRYAIAEERLSRIKLHSGFPRLGLKKLLESTGLRPDDIDHVAYPFYDWQHESALIFRCYLADIVSNFFRLNWGTYKKLKLLEAHKPANGYEEIEIPGLPKEKFYMNKPLYKRLLYEALAGNSVSDKTSHCVFFLKWVIDAIKSHKHFSCELYEGLKEFGISGKLKRVCHHEAHVYPAYFCSGYSRALVVSLDAYGSGMAGAVFLAQDGILKRLVKLPYPYSMGLFYEDLTSSLGFVPSRHEGKIVGLAAHGDARLLFDAVRNKFRSGGGYFKYICGHDMYFNRLLATKFRKIDIAASYQHVLEDVICELIGHYVKKFNIENIALAGGVVANVKLNQRVFEIEGVKNIFIYPNMGDGGTATGAALKVFADMNSGFRPYKLDNVYFGPDYSDNEIEKLLKTSGLCYEKVDDIELAVARLLSENMIVGRFNGRMEYGPRALGNRSILYQASEPAVNIWLNKQLGRTEFMPFAPSTLYEYRHDYYENIDGAEKAAEFMTITFDCTRLMKDRCPAAIHVDGTARPQLVRKEVNPSYYRIIDEYRKITNTATIINTSFNMHEEPIVCSPEDAIRAFKLGHLHYLAINNYLVKGELSS